VIILGSHASVDPTEYLYTLLMCVIGHHYKAFQWLNLVCSAHTEVPEEVSDQTTNAPLLRRVVLRRVHSFTHLFIIRRIHRESTLPAPLIGKPN
jgi:hypothetical protein